MTFAAQAHSWDVSWMLEQNEAKPVNLPIQLISEYIEGRRIMPTSTPFPGFWENSRTPYLIEPMDNMSPSSPIQQDI